MTTLKTAQADVAAASAQVKTARINLDYTTVRSPIAGRIGRAEVTEGAYVQQSSATLLASVQQLDKLYVDLTWSSAEALAMRRALASGALKSSDGEAKATIVLEDGRNYDIPGVLQFADVSVDQTTGSIALRAIVPNPKRELLPGMFVRAKIDEGTDPQAILVPQRGVTRDQSGKPVALVVDKPVRWSGGCSSRPGDRGCVVVTQGLVAGDQVIVEACRRSAPGVW